MPTVRRRLLVAALTVAAVAAGAPSALAAPQQGLGAEYFDYTDLTGKVAERIDQTVDFDWGQTEPVPGVGGDFSVRWTGVVKPPADGTYTFVTRTDDGVRLWVNGQLLIDDWKLHSASERSGHITLEGGKEYDLRLEYFDALKHAVAKLYWRRGNDPKVVVPATALATERTAPGPGPAPDPGAGPDPDPVPDPDPAPGPDAPGLPGVEVPKPGGVVAVVVPTGSGTFVPEIVPPSLLPGDAPAIVSYGGPLPPPAPPVPGVSFNAEPEGGEVLVRRPADGQLIPLQHGASLPIGTHVDVREGGVDIQTAPAEGFTAQPTQTAHFEGGMFRVGQSRRNGRIVTIDLLHGEFAEVCGPLSRRERRAVVRRRGVVARAAGNQRVLRRLWGKGKGRFRTRGRHAAATVRGTSWSIADRCDETSVRVHEGIVDVENLLTGARVTLTAGERHAVRP